MACLGTLENPPASHIQGKSRIRPPSDSLAKVPQIKLQDVSRNKGAGTVHSGIEGTNMITEQMRYQGCMLGLAAGDALGTTVEFKSPGSFSPLTDIVGGGPFGLDRGNGRMTHPWPCVLGKV
jgi:hypothetical protein